LKKVITIIFIFILLVFPFACGYHFSGTGKFPEGVKKICITMLKNNTSETGAEISATNALIYEFSRNGVTIVKDADKADAVLSGNITSLRTETIARKTSNISSERRVYVTLDLKMMSGSGRILWSGKGITDRETYQVTSSSDSNTDVKKKQAVEDLLKRLSETVYQRITDDF
jgi:outer membrane lipopolysaccharide assembly protein LptE/RlpB